MKASSNFNQTILVAMIRDLDNSSVRLPFQQFVLLWQQIAAWSPSGINVDSKRGRMRMPRQERHLHQSCQPRALFLLEHETTSFLDLQDLFTTFQDGSHWSAEEVLRYLYCINLTSVWRNDCEWSIIFITELIYQEISKNIDQ